MKKKLFLSYLPLVIAFIAISFAIHSGFSTILFCIGGGFFAFSIQDHSDEVCLAYTIKRWVNIVVICIAAILITCISGYEFLGAPMSTVYNKSVTYHNQFGQKTTEKKGFYDKLWKTFIQKEQIRDLNKETFITIAKIQMENRKDGQNITWKWVQENSPIPYAEFTKFYSDLSAFIETQRNEYYALEKECQTIATANNMLIDTFPNNIYNKFLGREHINFSYGFLSDSTNKVFESKMENIK